MIKNTILITVILLLILMINPFNTDGAYNSQDAGETEVELIPMEYYSRPEPVDPDYLKVKDITGWPLGLAKLFVDEARDRNVSVFEEALPVVAIETGYTYRFDLVNNSNRNGTSDKGIFQINDVTYPYIVKMLEQEGRELDSLDRLNPEFNIIAGILWIGHLKDTYGLESHALFSSYNRGITGAKRYAERNGTYETDYSRKVKIAKKEFNKLQI